MDNLIPILPSGPSAASLVIAGPCSAESREQTLGTARGLCALGVPVFRAGVWKPRTLPGSFEGAGLPALQWLREVKQQTGMLVATEVANKEHVNAALDAGVDILWLGARTTTNPFSVQEVAEAISQSGKDVGVLVKNPLNPDVELWIGALQRLYNAGVRRLAAVHRGFSIFGTHVYRNQPVWQVPFELRRRYPKLPIISDPSHIGGKRNLVAPLAQQALDLGFDGLIIESHCNPDEALSDKAQQLTPQELGDILKSLKTRRQGCGTEELDLLRSRIDECDSRLMDILEERMSIAREIGEFKKQSGMPVLQIDRHDEMMRSRLKDAAMKGLDPDFVKSVLSSIHAESVRQQLDLMKEQKNSI